MKLTRVKKAIPNLGLTPWLASRIQVFITSQRVVHNCCFFDHYLEAAPIGPY